MLGAATNPYLGPPDDAIRAIAKDLGREEEFQPAEVGIYFGQPGVNAADPYFDGRGPDRVGCVQCGACMTGCRYGSKNTLDKNYLYLAEQLGLRVQTETEVVAIRPAAEGYTVTTKPAFGRGETRTYFAKQVVLSAGVLGTTKLLLKLKGEQDGLPHLSRQVGQMIRTNNEALIGVTSQKRDTNYSSGIAISSILNTDEHSHVEPVRYGAGSGFFRLLGLPHAGGSTALLRLLRAARFAVRHPIRLVKAFLVPDWAKFTTILLYMRSLDETLSIELGPFGVLKTSFRGKNPPEAAMPRRRTLPSDTPKKWMAPR